MKKLFFCIIVLFLVSFSTLSFAATDRFSVIDFRPSPDGGEFFSVRSSTSLYKFQWTAGTAMDYAYKPLVEKSSTRTIIDRYIMQHFYGAIGFTDWLSIGFEMPVAWNNRVSDPDVATAPFNNKLDLGDPMFQVKARVLDKMKYPVGIAIVPFVTAPLGKKSEFMGDDGVTGGGMVVLDTNIKNRVTLALNAGASMHKKIVWRNVDKNSYSVLFGAAAAVNATDNLSFVVEGTVSTPTNHFFKEKVDTPAEFDGGIKYNIGKSGFQLYAGGGGGIVRGVGAPTARAFAGFSYKRQNEQFVTLDEERARNKSVTLQDKQQKEIQKFITLRDTCPKDPADFKPGVNDEGCPKYYELKEVADLVSKCPTRPEDFDPKKHPSDCNKVYTLTDKYGSEDASTVYAMTTVDLAEKCPLHADDFNPKMHDQACPKYYELKDISPLIAQCPSNPAKFNPKIHDASCPKVYELKDTYQDDSWMAIARLAKRDRDNDGVPDLEDKCPDIFGGKENFGCPLTRPLVEGQEIITIVPIKFKFNSYEITDQSAKALGELAERLIVNPKFGPIRIEGYADTVGPKVKNKVYSQKRAEAVKQYMVLHGVNADRLSTEWFGPTTKFGKHPENRRVVFILLK